MEIGAGSIATGRVGAPSGRITYAAAGDPARPAIVFLHGIGGGADLFAGALAALADAYRVIAWNMPGYAGSDPLPADAGGFGGIDAYARALGRFVRDLALERPILVGHSIGGMIVQAYLALGPDAGGPVPRGVVLAQTSAAFGGRDPRWAQEFVASRLGPLDRGTTMAEIAARAARSLVGDDPDPRAVPLAEAAMAATPEAAYRASTLAMIGFDRREALPGIAVPALLLAGTKDANAPAATMAKMAERVPGAEFLALEGCGHLVMLERPHAFVAALRAFADRVGDQTPAPEIAA